MARPILRLATRFTRRTRLTAWAIALACMVLVGSLVLIDGLANGVGSVADRISVGPYVYIEGEDLLESRIDAASLGPIGSDFTAIRIHGGILELNGLRLDIIVAAIELYVDGQSTAPFPAGQDDVALDTGLQERILRESGSDPDATGNLEIFGVPLPVSMVDVTGERPTLLPDSWAYVRPELLSSVDPAEGGPIQAIVTEAALDPALVTSLGLTRLQVFGGIGFVRESVSDAAVSLRLLAIIIAVLIGLLVYSAMSLEVHLRAAEIATLRSLGMSPRLVLSVYESQAVLLASAGSVLGAALGILISYAVVSLTPLVGLPNLVILETPIVPVALSTGIAVLAAAVAGVVPSRRAAVLVRSPEARPS